MIKTMSTAVLIGAVGLSGCASLSSLSQGQAPTVAEIQTDTQLACAFLPTAASIAAILTANSKSASANTATGQQIAALICEAATASAAAKSATPSVSLRRRYAPLGVIGVTIHGVFEDGTII